MFFNIESSLFFTFFDFGIIYNKIDIHLIESMKFWLAIRNLRAYTEFPNDARAQKINIVSIFFSWFLTLLNLVNFLVNLQIYEDQFTLKMKRSLWTSVELNPVLKDLLFRDYSDKCIESHNGLKEYSNKSHSVAWLSAIKSTHFFLFDLFTF